MQKIYSTIEVGKMFNVTSNTIKKWIKENDIDCMVSDGGHYKLTERNVQEIRKIIMQKYNLSEE